MAAMTLPMALSIGSAAIGAVGAISQGNAAAASARSQQQAENYNAVVSQQNANNVMQVANANEEAQRRKNAALMGTTRAGLIQAGIGTDGSAADIIDQSAKNTELDALNIRYDGILKARNYTNQGNLDVMQANAAGANASTAQMNGFIGAGASILNNGSSYLNNQNAIKFNNNRTTAYNALA